MAKTINTSITIQANPEKIWQLLTDFKDYSKWNPFIISIEGNLEPGNQLRVQLNDMVFKPKVKSYKKNQRFSWLGHLLFPGIFDGRHSFQLIKEKDKSTSFIHKEEFSGILPLLMRKSFFEKVEKDFKAMNEALKIEAERS